MLTFFISKQKTKKKKKKTFANTIRENVKRIRFEQYGSLKPLSYYNSTNWTEFRFCNEYDTIECPDIEDRQERW